MSNNKIESVQQAFEQFERDVVRVPKSDNDAAKAVHPEIRKTLASELAQHQETFLSGSYSRKVQAGRLKDVDIIVVLDDPDGKYAASALAALEDVQKAARCSDLVRSTKKGVRSVRLVLNDHDFTVDLVAALELLACYKPADGFDDWTLLHPRGQLSAAVKKNEECGGIYVPCVRLVKYWLGTVWGTDHKPFKSYHAEAVLHGVLSKKVDYADAMVAFFEAANTQLAPGVHTPDPGYPSANVDDLLDYEQQSEARRKVAIAMEVARAAFEEEDVGVALNGWAEVFGLAFPAPDTSPEKIAAAITAGTAGIVGSGVKVGGGREIIKARPWRP
jgi:hypothetical protein